MFVWSTQCSVCNGKRNFSGVTTNENRWNIVLHVEKKQYPLLNTDTVAVESLIFLLALDSGKLHKQVSKTWHVFYITCCGGEGGGGGGGGGNPLEKWWWKTWTNVDMFCGISNDCLQRCKYQIPRCWNDRSELE